MFELETNKTSYVDLSASYKWVERTRTGKTFMHA